MNRPRENFKYISISDLIKVIFEATAPKDYSKVMVVNNEEERLALTNLRVGDQCYEKETNKHYIFDGENWISLINNQKITAATEIISFKYDENSPDRTDNQTVFYLPEHNHEKAYLEISRNGIELVENKDYIVSYDAEKQLYYIEMSQEIEMTEIIHGEIYVFGSGEEKKSLIDVNNNTIEINESFKGKLLKIVDMPSIIEENNIIAILGTKLVIQNTSHENLRIAIYDNDIVLCDEEILPNNTKSFDLGVSIKTSVIVSGSGKYNFYVSKL